MGGGAKSVMNRRKNQQGRSFDGNRNRKNQEGEDGSGGGEGGSEEPCIGLCLHMLISIIIIVIVIMIITVVNDDQERERPHLSSSASSPALYRGLPTQEAAGNRSRQEGRRKAAEEKTVHWLVLSEEGRGDKAKIEA